MRFKNCSHELEYCGNPFPSTGLVVTQQQSHTSAYRTPKQRVVALPPSSVWDTDIAPLFRMPNVKGYNSYELYAHKREEINQELIYLVKHRMRGNKAEVFLCYGIVEYCENNYVMLKLRRKESVVVATIKRVDDEYLPTANKPIEVDLMGCRLPFWLQLTQEECPRKLYLEEGVEESNMVAEEFTFRRTLRRKPEECESTFERQAALVAEIERKEAKAHAKDKNYENEACSCDKRK